MSKLRPVIRKVDANQGEIVKILKGYGYLCESTHTLGKGLPDLLVAGWHYGLDVDVLLWVEVKMLGGTLTKDENEFFKKWQGHPVLIAFHARDVLRWFGHPEWNHV